LVERTRKWDRGEYLQLVDDMMRHVVRRQSTRSSAATNVKVAESLAVKGQLSKAMRRLRPSPLAEFDDDSLARLQALHPPSSLPIPDSGPCGGAFDVDEEVVLKALRSFVAGSAAGPSGMSPGHLLELCALPGSPVLPRLVSLVTDLLSGRHAGSYLYDAKLFAFQKPTGGLRPIACGETIRRLAAKVALACLKDDLKGLLRSGHQFGVAVPSGLEGIVHTFRRLTADDCDERIVVKVDFTNAFNSMERAVFIAAVDHHLPVLAPFVRAAYSSPSTLYFGDRATVPSAGGAQQGDPLGPALFALGCLACDHDLADVCGSGTARAWYLDDLTVSLPRAAVPALDRALTSFSRFGLTVNRAKSQVLCRTAVGDELLHGVPRGSLGSWELLGTPLGSDESVSAALAEKIADVAMDLTTIADHFNNVHAAYLLLYFCLGFPRLQHLLRTVGPHPAWEVWDAALRSAVSTVFAIPFTEVDWLQATLPIRAGGLGFRSSARHALPAFLASATASFDVSTFIADAPPADLLLRRVASSTAACNFYPNLLAAPGRHDQRTLSAIVDGRIWDALVGGDQTVAIRLRSTSSTHASRWLVTPGLSSEAFTTLVRLRLGLPVYSTTVQCPYCLATGVDEYGAHVLTCMSGGAHTRVHNAVRDALFAVARDAMLNPMLEWRPFPAPHDNLRADVFLPNFRERSAVVDVAVVNPARVDLCEAAASSYAGGATRYESVKVVKYRDAVASIRSTLVPAVFDVYGGFGQSAASFVGDVARRWSSHTGVPLHVAVPHIFGRVSLALARAVAVMLLAARGDSPNAQLRDQREALYGELPRDG
jgi:hypothetical protein